MGEAIPSSSVLSVWNNSLFGSGLTGKGALVLLLVNGAVVVVITNANVDTAKIAPSIVTNSRFRCIDIVMVVCFRVRNYPHRLRGAKVG